MLPYVVLAAHADGALAVVLGLAPLTHRQLAQAFWPTHAPRSAGYCRIYADSAADCFGAAPDLGLAPHPADGVLLFAQSRATLRAAAPVSALLPA